MHSYWLMSERTNHHTTFAIDLNNVDLTCESNFNFCYRKLEPLTKVFVLFFILVIGKFNVKLLAFVQITLVQSQGQECLMHSSQSDD